jgi:WD40 repeat protein
MARRETVELSEYEKQRQANIAQRDKLLKQLALDASSAGLGPKSVIKPLSKKENTQKKRTTVRKVTEEPLPRRTSSRLAGLTADSEVAKRKADDEYTAAQELARAKRQRVSGDLNLSDVVVLGKEWDKSQNFLVDIVSGGAKARGRTFGETEVRETTDKELRALREKMSGLQLYDGFEPNRIKITPERIYALGFHPTPDKPLIFAGDKMGNLGIFDASQTSNTSALKNERIKTENGNGGNDEDGDEDDDDDDPEPSITSFHLHTRTISSFQFSPLNASHLYTSSYDSSIRLLDLTKSTSSEIYAPLDSSADEPLSGVEVDPNSSTVLYFSRLDGAFGRTDTRSPGTPDIFQLAEKKIGGFSLHPGNPHIFATASLDRFMRLWDLRKLSGKSGQKLPALLGEHESRLSVSHAAFNAAGQVATASYDDTVKIHTFEGMSEWGASHKLADEEMAPSAIIRHNNQTGRWVTM